MKMLSDILANIDYSSNVDLQGMEVGAIATDSRKVTAGGLFVAINGLTVDGHDFIRDAVSRGCAAVVVNRGSDFMIYESEEPVVIRVTDSRTALGEIAAAFYGQPADGLCLIGITGTNGKTTTTYLIESIIRESGGNPGVIGTINYRYNNQETVAAFTTPEPVDLQKILAEMAASGVTHVVMEVSSHALAQQRLQGVMFDVAVFTNLTRDHLDFHGDMEKYFQAKELLFTEYLKDTGVSVIFFDDAHDCGAHELAGPVWGESLCDAITDHLREKGATPQKIISCAMSPGQDIGAGQVEFGLKKTDAALNVMGEELRVTTHLVGEFNLKNLLVATGVAAALDIKLPLIRQGVFSMLSVPGRLEMVSPKDSGGGQCVVFVDYAHTPDALENVLTALRKLKPTRLLVVFGCGGDRDSGKRCMMGKIAGERADFVFITSDNSRSESTESIVAEIVKGVELAGKKNCQGQEREGLPGYTAILSRSEAIAAAISCAGVDDIVLISGKGHETYQITRAGKTFFDDRQEARDCLAKVH